ncbi:MAG TPA: nascent polypeptide-associated complex protein [Candidatus Nanoarchaeia archaeon]|nr:nascent polypeptide-associated complex protein [Candidatus Nanoarchaeia archaeon]
MFPGMGIDPRKMQGMLRQMGIKQDAVEAVRVVIEKSDGGKLVIENPDVQKIDMKGQVSWQISGDVREEEAGVSADDVALVVEKTGASEEDARAALDESKGDIAAAIVALSA